MISHKSCQFQKPRGSAGSQLLDCEPNAHTAGRQQPVCFENLIGLIENDHFVGHHGTSWHCHFQHFLGKNLIDLSHSTIFWANIWLILGWPLFFSRGDPLNTMNAWCVLSRWSFWVRDEGDPKPDLLEIYGLDLWCRPSDMVSYPLVNKHSYGKSLFFMGKSTINGHFQ